MVVDNATIVRLTKHIGRQITGEAPRVKFMNDTEYVARCCTYADKKHAIIFSRPWIDANRDNHDFMVSIIVHEVAHMRYPNHGRKWKTLCARWGARFETHRQRDCCYPYVIPGIVFVKMLGEGYDD